ncbi:MAG: hypothetical protein IKY71_09675 [Bacteroidaceae bacterium]|nr:hypothetical protein [Bacteroidaceae bacterium]
MVVGIRIIMVQLAIITISLFLTIFCRYETGSMELTWWEAYQSRVLYVELVSLCYSRCSIRHS